mmetsp:Transcript_70932/g.220082  ORF Transcript_70932/g.220082 Transcript_70932/m.220082 type:complete len:102 (-) Transcript_70932:24-329(-)
MWVTCFRACMQELRRGCLLHERLALERSLNSRIGGRLKRSSWRSAGGFIFSCSFLALLDARHVQPGEWRRVARQRSITHASHGHRWPIRRNAQEPSAWTMC